MPNGDRPPPRPPKLTAIGFDDHGGKRRVTVARSADGEGKFVRRSQYGHVVVRLEPSGRGKGITVRSDVSNGAIPEQFIESVTEGIRESLNFGIEGIPVVDVAIRILDGSWNERDSDNLAFKMAGIFAVKDAMKRAEPIYIE
jgi:elongation factor G